MLEFNQKKEQSCAPVVTVVSAAMQHWQEPYDLCTALKEGTIFPELNKPFFMGGQKMQDKTMLLKTINENSFAVDDVKLFLDTHPDDQEALAFFHHCKTKRKQAMEEFEQNFYPLTVDCISNVTAGSHWTWNDGPAPWEGGIL